VAVLARSSRLNQQLFVYLASILPLGVAAQWLAWRFRLPSILLLLAFGFGLGQAFDYAYGVSGGGVDLAISSALLSEHGQAEPAGGAPHDEGSPAAPTHEHVRPERLLFPLVSLAVAVILFEGGMTLKLSELREAGRPVLQLCTLGALIAWAAMTVAAMATLGFGWRASLLLGAILVVTGPTVIGPLLRHIRPVKRVGSVAKWEGIVIDPIGAVLAVLVFTAVAATGTAEEAFTNVAWALTKTVLVGGLLGVATGWLLVQLLSRFLVPDFLQNAFFLAVLLAMFAASNILQKESGLVTVTVLGFYLGNQKRVAVHDVMQFKENLQVLLISTLFIVMASRIDVADLTGVGLRGIAFLAVLILAIRPLSVFLGTLGSGLKIREQVFLAFLAPRGIVAAAVASIFALEIAIEGAHSDSAQLQRMMAEAPSIVPATFIVIVGTVAIYGLAAGPLARKLGLSAPTPQGMLFAGAPAWAVPFAVAVKDEGFSVLMVDTNYDHTAQARMAGVPAVCASVLSEYVQEELDLSGIGRLLAVTANDEVNTLATQEMSHQFGRKEVYQLAPWDVGEGRRKSVVEHLQGRMLWGEKYNFSFFNRRHNEGYQIKKTTLSEEFTYRDYRERYGERAIVLFTIADGKLTVVVNQDDLRPPAGAKLIALTPPEAKSTTKEKIRQKAKQRETSNH